MASNLPISSSNALLQKELAGNFLPLSQLTYCIFAEEFRSPEGSGSVPSNAPRMLLPPFGDLHRIVRCLRRHMKLHSPYIGDVQPASIDVSDSFTLEQVREVIGLYTETKAATNDTQKDILENDIERTHAETAVPVFVKRAWTQQEDDRLTKLVEKFGARAWSGIAVKLASRTAKQCRERWHHHLKPSVNKKPWKASEDEIIFSQRRIIGKTWSDIAKLLPGRGDNAVKNRYYSTVRRLIRYFQKRYKQTKAGTLAMGESEIFNDISERDRFNVEALSTCQLQVYDNLEDQYFTLTMSTSNK